MPKSALKSSVTAKRASSCDCIPVHLTDAFDIKEHALALEENFPRSSACILIYRCIAYIHIHTDVQNVNACIHAYTRTHMQNEAHSDLCVCVKSRNWY